MNGPRTVDAARARHRRHRSHARTTLRPPRSVRERMAALMRDLRHDGAVAYPDLAAWIDYLDLEELPAQDAVQLHPRDRAPAPRAPRHRVRGVRPRNRSTRPCTLKPARSRYITRSIFNGWFNWGVEQDRLDRNPMPKVAKPQAPEAPPQGHLQRGRDRAARGAPVTRRAALHPALLLRDAEGRGPQPAPRPHRPEPRPDGRHREGRQRHGSSRSPPKRLQAVADLDLLEGLQPTDYLWYSMPGGRRRISRGHPDR